MNNVQTLVVVLAVIVFAFGGVLGFVLPLLKRRGVDVEAVMDGIKDALATSNGIWQTVQPFLTELPGAGTFDRILDAANVGVANAEQLLNAGKLEKGERKDAARQYVKDTLGILGVEVTPEVERLVDGAIEAEVFNMKRGG